MWFWIILIIFILSIIGKSLSNIGNNTYENDKVDWWTLGAMIDMSNKYADSVKKNKK